MPSRAGEPSISSRPDVEHRNDEAVEELWDSPTLGYAVEHTRVESFEGQLANFAFSRLISCGHCGCAFVGEVKKNRYDDERKAHDEAIERLQADYARLQNRLGAMYIDKLDGRIDAASFDRMAAGWRAGQSECLRPSFRTALGETGNSGSSSANRLIH